VQSSSECLEQLFRPWPAQLGRGALFRSFVGYDAALRSRLFPFSATGRLSPLFRITEIAHFSTRIAVQHADARGLVDGLIWPKTGFASIV
jgi:hypothetical protein